MSKISSLFLSFSGGFFSGAVITVHAFTNKGLHPLEYLYKKQNDNFTKN